MSYKDYLKGIILVENNKVLIEKKSIGKKLPQTKDLIESAEKKLDVHFPNSYKDFLIKFGKMTFGGECIYGLDNWKESDGYWESNIICNTLDKRRVNTDPDSPFPLSFVVVYNLGNGEKYCLDTAQMNKEGECPVVGWYFGRIEKIHEDFGEFFLWVITSSLESLEEDGHKVKWD